MPVHDLSGTTAVVTGASRGFGRATSLALAARGAHVVGVARNEALLDELSKEIGAGFTVEVADVADPSVATRLLTKHRPRTIVLNAGATPNAAPLRDQDWENFSANWQTDVRHVFNFAREALGLPLEPGSVVVSLSSGAALRGSPLSGGYAGAKAAIRFISSAAAWDAGRTGAGIRFVALLPQLTPATDLGRTYTEIYAEAEGLTVTEYVERGGGALGADQVGEGIAALVTDDAYDAPAYLITHGGLAPVG
ncbi:MAG TPA: SDR family oxidoreductase [Acidimicrobiales bacterium]|nr:SDR family oxidoreductase [Acidimicrobiales bacterium]